MSLAAYAAATYVLPGLRICRDEPASTGDAPVAQICAPVGANDLVVIGLALFVILLILLPDLSELGVTGLFTMKRRVTDVELRQEQLERTVALSVAANQQLTTNLTIYPPSISPQGDQPSPARRDAEEKVERVNRAGLGTFTLDAEIVRPRTEPRRLSAERALVESQLVSAWEGMRAFVQVQGLVSPEAVERLGPIGYEEYSAIRTWNDLFRQEIEVVRAARNTIVHEPQNLTDDEVREALEVAKSALLGLNRITSTARSSENV